MIFFIVKLYFRSNRKFSTIFLTLCVKLIFFCTFAYFLTVKKHKAIRNNVLTIGQKHINKYL
jgi:uncharacterized membrane protein YukC